jgi:F-type H+-transporting ATPase subunit b
MDELIKTFHIETSLLLAQFVNFAIVLFVLYKFAYGPILKTLNARTKKIEKGLKDSEKASKKLGEVMEKEKIVLHEARKEAQEIIKKSEDEAKKNAEIIAAEARLQTEKMTADAKKQIEQEKERVMTDVKSEIAGLVVAATEKVIGEKLDASKDKGLIERAIKR